jgi:hypothetical protein
MDSETNGSIYQHPGGSTPILTINIPGGLTINLLGITIVTCPILINVFLTYPTPPKIPVEDNVTNAPGHEPSGTSTQVSHEFPPSCNVTTGSSRNVTNCSFKRGQIPIKRPKLSKHLKPIKPPKPLKHP